MLTKKAETWLQDRGIDVELAVRLGFDSFEPGSGGEELVIPYLVDEAVANRKYRRLDGKAFRQDKGAVRCFWNVDVLADSTLASEPVIVTEGELDAVCAIQAGFPRAVSVPDGAPGQEIGDRESRCYAFLEQARDALRPVKEIILATDGDGPGVALMNDLALRLGRARCKWVTYPKRKDGDGRCKDLNEALVAYGEDGIKAVIARAQWCRVDGIYRMSELRPIPERQAISTGFPFLDRHFRVRLGDFSVITGIPGHGKSTWANDWACRMARGHGWTVAMASFEQHPQTDHRRALRQWFCGKAPAYCTADELQAADQWIDERFVFIVPSEEDLATLSWTLERVSAAVTQFGAKLVVIDPWNELDHDHPPGMSETEYTGRAIKEFKRLARNLDVHVAVIAHPRKLLRGEAPGLYDISGSAHWANKPDVGIIIGRDENLSTLDVVKSRYWDQIGTPGSVHMMLNTQTMRFEEAVGPEELAA